MIASPGPSACRLASLFAPVALALLAGCAEGGVEDRPLSEVTVTETHHLFGVVGATAFADFPVTPAEAGVFDGRIELDGDAAFEITRNSTVVADGTYALEEDGDFALLITRPGLSSLVWQGGFGRNGNTGRSFLTDRFGDVGLYLGAIVEPGMPDLDTFVGTWQVFTLQVQFAPATVLNPTTADVGRSLAGVLSATRPDPMGDVVLDGTVIRALSPSTPTTATGSLAGFDGGSFSIGLDYGAASTAEERTYAAGGDNESIFGVETGQNGQVAGLVAMVRERAAPVDITTLEGDWIAGIWTVFPLPERSGVDAALGTCQISSTGTYRLTAFDNTGTPFVFEGAISTAGGVDGGIEVTEQRFTETWTGGVSIDDGTIVIIDNVAEARPAGISPELNMIVLIRAGS